MTRVVFMGSPAVALASLEVLAASPAVTLAGVLTQPARPAGRRRSPQPCPVAQRAQALGLPVLMPERLRDPAVEATLRAWGTELAIVCAYGKILPAALLDLPPLGCYNLHFSLLPRWRGASPVQAALLAGDATTGVTLQRMAPELDAGEIVATTGPLPILSEDTAATLGERLAAHAAGLLGESLALLVDGRPPLRPQDPAGITVCRVIRKEEGAVDFAAESAVAIERKCRAYTPWPGCFGFVGGRRLGLVRVALAGPEEAAPPGTAPGTLLPDGRVPAREGTLRLLEVKPEGKGAMPLGAFLNGHPEAAGARITPHPAP